MSLKADASGMLQALAAVHEAMERNTAAVKRQKTVSDEAAEAAKKNKKEELELTREAERIKKSQLTDMDRHKEKLAQLQLMQSKGLLQEHEYRRAESDAPAELWKRGEALKKTTTAQTSWASTITATAAALGGVALAQRAITQAMQDEFDLRQKIQGIREAASGGAGRLLQLADTPEQYRSLTSRAESLRRAGAASTLEEAMNLVFAVESPGFGSDYATVEKIGQTKLLPNIAQTMANMKTVQDAIGRQETGGFNSLLSKSITGAKAMGADADQFMRAMARAGGKGGAQGLGLSDEEIAAFLMTTGDALTAERMGEIGSATLRAYTRLGFEGKSLPEIKKAIDAKKLSKQGMIEYLGSAEAQEGHAVFMTNFDRYAGNLQAQKEADDGSRLRRQLAIGSDEAAVDIASRAQKGQTEVNLYQQKYRSLLETSRMADRDRNVLRYGPTIGGATSYINETLNWATNAMAPEGELISRVDQASRGKYEMDPTLFRAILAELKKNNHITEQYSKTLNDMYASQQRNKEAAPQSQPKTEQ